MPGLQIVKATKKDAKARMALLGPTGSGKTFTALEIALGLAGIERMDPRIFDLIGVIDTEHKSSEKYVDIFGEFAAVHLDNYDPRRYIEAIEMLARAGYKVIIIDSLSHAWAGKGGALELKDRATAQNGGNSYTAWAKVTPLQNQLIDTIIACPSHVIATMRTKMDHVQEQDARGRTVVRKIGMGAVQRDGVEYEFDVVGELDIDNVMTITKTRNPSFKGLALVEPTRAFGRDLAAWLAGPVAQGENVVQMPQARSDAWAAPPPELPAEAPPPPADPPSFDDEFADQDQGTHEGRPEGTRPAWEPDQASPERPEERDPSRDEVWWPMPGATHFTCQAVGCGQTFHNGEEIVFGGRRFRGRQLADRCLGDEGPKKPLCAPHLKAWTEGDDVFTEAVPA